MAVRDAVRLVFRTQLEDAPEERIIEARKLLNNIYDSFVARLWPPLLPRQSPGLFAGDPDQPLLLSLEIYDAETRRAQKTAIFERRTLERHKPAEHVETAAEALAISLNETGRIHWPLMEKLTGHSSRQLQRELDSLVYRNPEGEWETADRYLSGDVRAKLKTAEAAAALDPSYRRNVEALKEVQPVDLLPGDISARLGSSWIPASDVKRFVAELLDTPERTITVSHSGAIATWALTLDSYCEIQRQQHDDLGDAAGARFRPDRRRAQRTHADHLRPDRQRHARRQPAGNDCRARGAAEDQGPVQRMDMAGRGTRPAPCPAL